MKRILLTTTSLVLAAGVAQADVTFSGKGEVSVAQADGTADMTLRTGYDMNVAVSGASDTGMTYSMGFDMGAGSLIDYNDDYAIDPQTDDVAVSALTIGYSGVTIVLGQDESDDLYDDTQNGDVSIAGAFGGLNFAAVLDTDSGATSNSFSLSGSADAITWSLVSTDANDAGEAAAKVTVGYTVSDALSMSFKHDNKGAADAINTVSATYTMGALTLTASADDNSDNDFGVGYTAGALAVSYSTDEEDAWEFNTTYDLGGGAQAFASTNASEFAAVGMSFAF